MNDSNALFYQKSVGHFEKKGWPFSNPHFPTSILKCHNQLKKILFTFTASALDLPFPQSSSYSSRTRRTLLLPRQLGALQLLQLLLLHRQLSAAAAAGQCS